MNFKGRIILKKILSAIEDSDEPQTYLDLTKKLGIQRSLCFYYIKTATENKMVAYDGKKKMKNLELKLTKEGKRFLEKMRLIDK